MDHHQAGIKEAHLIRLVSSNLRIAQTLEGIAVPCRNARRRYAAYGCKISTDIKWKVRECSFTARVQRTLGEAAQWRLVKRIERAR
jgi:hypothetical protein